MATFQTFTPSFRVQKAACEKCHSRKVRCDISSRPGSCSNCSNYGEVCTLRTRKRKASGVQKRNSMPLGSNQMSPTSRMNTSQVPANAHHSPTDQQVRHNGTRKPPGGPLLFVQGLTSPHAARSDNTAPSQPSPDEFQNSSYLSRRAILSDDFPNLDHSHERRRRRSFSLPQRDIEVLNLHKAFDLPPIPIRQSLVEAYLARAWTWMPVVDPTQMLIENVTGPPSSLVLAQALLMVGSQMRRSVHPDASTMDCYSKLKVLIDVGHERNPISLLASLCLIQWWTPVAPRDISTNTPRFWLCCAVGLAQQVGLHKSSLKDATDGGLRRRIWWTLYARDCIVSAAHGRPRLINLADCSVERPTLQDFPESEDFRSRIFIAYVCIIEILSDLCQILTRQNEATVEQKNQTCSRLLSWIQSLPPDLRLQYPDGSARQYDIDVAQLHVPLLTAITILYRPRSIFNLSASNAASVVAANLNFRIFEAMELRDDTFSLASAYAWYMFVVAVPQLSCLRVDGGLAEEARQRLDRLGDILRTLSAVRPAAANNLRNVQSLQQYFENPDLPSRRRLEPSRGAEQDAPLLFSPEELFAYFGPDAVESFHTISATLETHQPRSIPDRLLAAPNSMPTPTAVHEAPVHHNPTDEEFYGGFPELFGLSFADSSWMRNWIDELQLPSG
jgi:Fungal specific transcription factor domain/Fungal Zn(2)-Cys(6) binuclear cluster domain